MSLIRSSLSDAFCLYASLNWPLSVTRFGYTRHCWPLLVTCKTRHWFSLIIDARTVTCLFRVTNDCLDVSLITFSGIVLRVCARRRRACSLAAMDGGAVCAAWRRCVMQCGSVKWSRAAAYRRWRLCVQLARRPHIEDGVRPLGGRRCLPFIGRS
jgi:hypothetical protein